MEKGKKYWFLIKREEESKGSQFIGRIDSIENSDDGVKITITDRYGLKKMFFKHEVKGFEEKGYGKRYG